MKIAVGISGGKDSTALLLWVLENIEGEIYPVFADTKWEHPLNYEYLNYLQDKLGIKIYKVTCERFDGMLDLIRKKKMFPSYHRRFCTHYLKIKPIIKFLRENDIDVYVLGVRLDESTYRTKKYANINPDKWYEASDIFPYCPKSLKTRIRLPLLKWSEGDVISYIKWKGIKINPLYEKYRRVGCYPCLISSRDMESVMREPLGLERVGKLLKLEEELNSEGFHTRIHPDVKKADEIRELYYAHKPAQNRLSLQG